MCVEIYSLDVLKRPKIAYKVVRLCEGLPRDDIASRQSEFYPTERGDQVSRLKVSSDTSQLFIDDVWHSTGELLTYQKGVRLHSPIPETPGIYLCPTLVAAQIYNISRTHQFRNKMIPIVREIVKVLIPAGSTVIRGFLSEIKETPFNVDVMMASDVLVLE